MCCLHLVGKQDPKELLRDIGRKIAEARAARWTQEEFAELRGIQVRYFARLERGLQNFTIETLCSLGNDLGVTVQFLLEPPADREIHIGRPKRNKSVESNIAETLVAPKKKQPRKRSDKIKKKS